MPATITVQANDRQMKQAEQMLANIRNGFPTAMSRAINRTGTKMKSRIAAELKSEMNIKSKFARAAIQFKGQDRATKVRLFGVVHVRSGHLPLLAFGARQTKKGVSYKSPSGRTLITGGFINVVRGVKTALRRVSGTRYPIRGLWGPSLSSAYLAAPGFAVEQEQFGVKFLDGELMRQVDVLLAKQGDK